MISDTPAEAEPSFDCEIDQDTCSSEGNDPVRNYMVRRRRACLQFSS
jgi:hypothetical protein